MPIIRLIYFLYLMLLFITTVNLIAPIQIQGQPATSEVVCFPVEDNGHQCEGRPDGWSRCKLNTE